MNADPETVFYYINPTPHSPRSTWDRAIKELQMVATVSDVCYCCTYAPFSDNSTLLKLSLIRVGSKFSSIGAELGLVMNS